ncbi:helix-turn-helix domain-containing protein [Streptomyces sp. NPDC058676]|uniref:helix-turn-helix domain-containing protein n=1 Tax=unclassified Streptomyces TaxID=2593676 RepID=UPI00365E81E3
MMQDVFNSQDLPPEDRVGAWQEITAHSLAPNEFSFSTDQKSEFQASLRAAQMDEAQVVSLTYSTLRSRRTPKLIRRSDPDMYVIVFVQRGRHGIVQEGREENFGVQDLMLYSESRPYEALVDSQQGMGASVLARIPRSRLPLPSNQLDRLVARRLPRGDSGVGGLLAGFLTRLATDTTTPYRPADARRLGTVIVDLATCWLAHCLEAEDQTPTETRQQVLLLQAQAFIAGHLGDPELSPATVAAAHFMSLRSLHRLFQNQGTTVAAFIRHQRLARTRHELADPLAAGRPVHAIAARWGFPRPADFTRAFRAAYGMTPSDYRRLTLSDTPWADNCR